MFKKKIKNIIWNGDLMSQADINYESHTVSVSKIMGFENNKIFSKKFIEYCRSNNKFFGY